MTLALNEETELLGSGFPPVENISNLESSMFEECLNLPQKSVLQ